MTEFRQSHRSTTPKWSSFSSQGGDFVLPAPSGPTAPATDCNRGPPSQQQSPIQTQNLNQEETARQRRGNRTSNTPRTARRPPPTLAPTTRRFRSGPRAARDAGQGEPRGATESGAYQLNRGRRP